MRRLVRDMVAGEKQTSLPRAFFVALVAVFAAWAVDAGLLVFH